jgi:hypothetical protein
MRVFQEEIFGPVLAVTTFSDYKEAIAIANDTLHGLGAGVHGEVVVGVSDPHDADATLGYAFDEAALRGATLVAVHSLNWSRSGRARLAGPGARPPRPRAGQLLRPCRSRGDRQARRDLYRPAVGGIQHALLNHARGPVAVVPATG